MLETTQLHVELSRTLSPVSGLFYSRHGEKIHFQAQSAVGDGALPFSLGPCSCTPSSGRDSSFLRLPAHVARRRAGHISSVPSHDRISFAPRPRVDGGAVGDCNWDDLSSPSNILFNLSHGRNTFPNTSGGSPLLGRHRQWYVIHRIFYALVLSSRYLSRGSRDLYVSLLIISSSHTSNLSLVFRFRSQAWSIRPRGRNISHLLHLHDLLDVRS